MVHSKGGGVEYILSVVGHWLGQTHFSELATCSEIVLFLHSNNE